MRARTTQRLAMGAGGREMAGGLRRAVAILAWLILAVIVFSTLSPIGMRPRLGVFVHLERFGAFAAMGFLFAIVHSRRAAAVLVCIVVAVVGLELLQMTMSDRHARLSDLAVKAAGGVFGVACGWFLMRNRAPVERLMCRLACAARGSR